VAVNILLPILDILSHIQNVLAKGNNLVLQAEPGAGKSTALPMSLITSEWLKGRKIIMLEPRRVAVKTIAHYLAKQLGERVGQRIGYHIKVSVKRTHLPIINESLNLSPISIGDNNDNKNTRTMACFS